MTEISLWLFVINLGIAFGAGIYEIRIVLPKWFEKTPESGYRVRSEAMRETDVGRQFWGMVTTLPLTILTMLNLYFASKSAEPAHFWWLLAAAISLVERLGTFTFFIPTAIKLEKSNAPSDSKTSLLVARWIGFNYLRNLLTLIAWLAALKTFSIVV